jgi:ABC-type branched-subunit amino acid transport system substrate-binding protein
MARPLRQLGGTQRLRETTLDVALVIPLHGSAGLFGPSCELCAQLAAEELNAAGGVLARELRLSVVDGSGPPARVADEVGAIVAAGLVDAVVGWHISAVRQAIVPRVAGRVPYVYTALYEGGERAPGVFLAGETPSRQLLPAMRWLREQHGVRRWAVVGDDYVWPRDTARSARAYASLCDGRIVDEVFVPLGTTDFAPVVRQLRASAPDAVLMLLVGEDAVHFNRAFAAAGMDDRCRRLSTLMDENMLLASGAAGTRGICAAAAYFETLTTPESLDFGGRYTRRFGPEAPMLNSLGESCYEGIQMLAALARQAGGLDVRAMTAHAASASFAGPRGELRVRGDNHVDQRVYLAEAHELGFDIVAQLQAPAP